MVLNRKGMHMQLMSISMQAVHSRHQLLLTESLMRYVHHHMHGGTWPLTVA